MIATQSPKTGIEVSSRKSQSAKIIRAQALRPYCTSLPSLEPYYRHRLQLHLRRAACLLASKRCSLPQPSVLSQSTVKAGDTRPVLELPLFPSMCEDATSVVSFTHLSPSSSTSSLGEENYTITTRPPSRHGVAYEIVFSAPSVQRCYTPQPQLNQSDCTYSFARTTAKSTTAEEFDVDDWNTDGEFEDSDAPESEEEAENDHDEKESEQNANVAPPAPQCKYGVFFTAVKPPLPPSALERIRRYRNYEV